MLSGGRLGSSACTDECDIIELNTLHTENGSSLPQVIFWGWRRGTLVVHDFKVSPNMSETKYGYDHDRGKYYWKFTVSYRGASYPVVMWARTFVVTETKQPNDPEFLNRKVLSVNHRRGIFPQLGALLNTRIRAR